ncbi:class I lanthipeptide [Aquimarina sediminis]|uniref:class I lanthipeptide n=1 Tax=Aquimarina sediminis TaxID=2070536 RepID=UPI0013E8A090|nr:class I lanthipeptide [Aquimarina sediminis]
MKKHKSKNLSIKKVTIARINVELLHQIKGGTSRPTTAQVQPSVIEEYGDSICYDVH